MKQNQPNTVLPDLLVLIYSILMQVGQKGPNKCFRRKFTPKL